MKPFLSDCDIDSCDFDSEYRTISGCCNNQLDPNLGKKKTIIVLFLFIIEFIGRTLVPLIRLLPADYEETEMETVF